MRADIVRLSALTALILAVILIVLFRSTWPVVLALGATGLATLAMLALVTAFGHSFSVLTTTTPTMILSIGVTYAVYMIEIYTHTEGDRTARARAMVRSAAPPVIVSAVTTMAGFASLATTHISAIREFAVAYLRQAVRFHVRMNQPTDLQRDIGMFARVLGHVLERHSAQVLLLFAALAFSAPRASPSTRPSSNGCAKRIRHAGTSTRSRGGWAA